MYSFSIRGFELGRFSRLDKQVGGIDNAHEGIIWDIKWHPLGHITASASNDFSTKFWTRNNPGDKMKDKYNLNIDEELETGEQTYEK